MKSKWILADVFISLIITILHFLPIYQSNAKADQGCDRIIITETGNHKNCKLYPLCFAANNPIEITCGTPETILIEGGTPPFIWADPGMGYSWTYGEETAGGKQTSERSNQLTCSGST